MNRMWNWLGAALLLALLPTASLAQEYVSVADVYEQAQAMGGVWQETFDTPFGELTVDVPVIVPDVETMPVLTVEYAKISEELFGEISQGKKLGAKDELTYETRMNGETVQISLGRNYSYIYGKQTDKTGYDAVSWVSMYHGDSYERNKLSPKYPLPTSFLNPWELDLDAPCVRNNDITVNEAMRLWQEDIALAYPGEEFTIRPTRILMRGSIVEPHSDEENNLDGYLKIEAAEQLIGGIPLMGKIGYDFAIPYGATVEKNRECDRLNIYRVGSDSVLNFGFLGTFRNENDYKTSSQLARTRTVEHEDVPLAPLERVLESVREEIEAGNIRNVYSVELGYILYSNPDMTDYAWAIPRWKVEANYVTKDMRGIYDRGDDEPELWGGVCFANLPADAQSGELIIYDVGSAEIFGVPDMVTWDEVR